eukprot:CAMPEP_0202807706 /NCGR_PEP_ID=MMETSP1389-20130828/388_1 /ASSEMBLY_ACC=CAM_ASM_000865 /TAXON_ID=302021 /ORGANISM="Rhodomonas sp., Strain CCMP768" /LENGTH=135 /DNA_ID=CAMNT_0049477801 /DNA_START=32 /DNA_END=437 /DNA_ORIENTATION=-
MADIEEEEAPVADEGTVAAGGAASGKRFEVKKWNAVALWAWDIVVDNCAICRNHIMDLCIECQAHQASAQAKSAQLLGASATTPSTSIVFLGGSRPVKFVLLTTEIGNSRSTVGDLVTGKCVWATKFASSLGLFW